jgi:DNA polymerase I-like protein with 3'-5' exonuclease and polymerase domains
MLEARDELLSHHNQQRVPQSPLPPPQAPPVPPPSHASALPLAAIVAVHPKRDRSPPSAPKRTLFKPKARLATPPVAPPPCALSPPALSASPSLSLLQRLHSPNMPRPADKPARASKRPAELAASPLPGGPCVELDAAVPIAELRDAIRTAIGDDSRSAAVVVSAAALYGGGEPRAAGDISGAASSFAMKHELYDDGAACDVSECLAQLSAVVLAFDGAVCVVRGGADAAAALQALLRDFVGVDVVGFNVSTLLLPLAALHRRAHPAGPPLPLHSRCVNDVRVMGWLVLPDEPTHHFDATALRHAGGTADVPGHSPRTLSGVVLRTLQLPALFSALTAALVRAGLHRAYLTVEKALPAVLCDMKFCGFPYDAERVRATLAAVHAEAVECEAAACAAAGCTVKNLASPQEVTRVIFDVLQLGVHLAAGAKRDSAAATLELLAPHHAFPGCLLRVRKVAKLRITLTSVFGACSGGKVHANFVQTAVDTGRLSCREPNLQNLQRPDADHGSLTCAVRGSLVPFPRHVLVAFDYEQIEVRMLAHLSRDQALCDALTSADSARRDLHRNVAARIYRKAFGDVTAAERTAAKRIVFGVMYGMGRDALAAACKMSRDEVQRLLTDFSAMFPQLHRYRRAVLADCHRDGCVRTLFNKQRVLPGIRDRPDSRSHAEAERKAFNTVVQGSAADVVKKAMVDVNATVLQRAHRGVLLLSQIHDELLFSVPENDVAAAVPAIRQAMEGCVSLTVPLPVKVSVGPSYGALVDYRADELCDTA